MSAHKMIGITAPKDPLDPQKQQQQVPLEQDIAEENKDTIMSTEPIDVQENHNQAEQRQPEEKDDIEPLNSPDIIPDHNSVNNQSALPEHQFAVPVAPMNHQQQRPAVSWAPMDQELAHSKIRDQRRLLKKQHRAIKYLKNEVACLKRKLQEMEQFYGQQEPAPPLDMSRRVSAGDHPPSKKARPCSVVEEGSSVYNSNVSLDDSETDPIPLEIKPDNLRMPAAKLYSYQPKQQKQGLEGDDEETPNTFRVKNQPILDPYGDQGSYSGSVSNSSALPHGRGRMLYDDNQRVYSGGWNNGRWHGVGQAIFANGDTYQGDYHMDQRHGRGRYAWVDGRSYEGDFKADKRHGKGVFLWPDGARYEGEFVNGFREGHGTYVFCGGCKYTGEWKDGRYNGVGSCIWTDGRCYSGEWRDGLRNGRGIETEGDGTIRHDGQWCDDEPLQTETDKALEQASSKRRSSAKTEKGRAQGWLRKSISRDATKDKH